MSPEDRQQLQQLLDDMDGSLLAEIGRGRREVALAAIQATIDAQGLIVGADAAKQAHLVDRVLYRDQLLDELKAATGRTGGKEPFKQIGLPGLHRDEAGSGLGSANRIAVVYAEGEIVDGEGDTGEVGGEKFAVELRKLRQDSAVKAIVLRVNSPGGSVTASEEIQREIRLARQVKPVIVSMGNYAASGGYWISTFSDHIFAETNTITGSIGVFGIQFDVQKLAADYGVTFDRVKVGQVCRLRHHHPPEDRRGDGDRPAPGRLVLRPVHRQGGGRAETAAGPGGGDRAGSGLVGGGGP